MNDLISLPLDTLLVLGTGYLSYCIVHGGLRDNHSPMDVTFNTIVFGMFTKLALNLAGFNDQNQLIPATTAVLSTIALAIIWKRYLRDLCRKFLRWSRVSHSDETPTAWDRIRTETMQDFTQISVFTNKGVFHCSDLSRLGKLPFGPCVFGKDGSISLYADRVKDNDGEWIDKDQTSPDPFWGTKVTYIPASEIVRIETRTRNH